MEVPLNDLFSLFSCTKYEISKICSDSGNAAMTLRVLLELLFGEFQPFFLRQLRLHELCRRIMENYRKNSQSFFKTIQSVELQIRV